jgi:hypothetical protein
MLIADKFALGWQIVSINLHEPIRARCGVPRARGQTETTENEDFLPALDDKRGLVVDAILFTDLL